MANDRLGVRWGLAGGTTLATVEEVRAAAQWADASGFDSLWVSHAMAVHPIVALACVGADAPHLTELGTSVVPLYGRHPIDVAQQAMTAQTALGGRFTLGIGAAASATCTIIPEEFSRDRFSLADICDIIEGSIVKRRAMNKEYGVALLSEALSEHFSPEEVTELEDVDRDAQGNIRVAEIDLGRKVKSVVQSRLEKRGIKVTLVDKTIGYELRCAPPIPYDAEHARDLGYAAVKYLQAGGSGVMITMQNGEFTPVPFSEVIDHKTGRGRLRSVDVTTENYRVARDYMVRLEPKDFANEAWLAQLSGAAGLSVPDFKSHFAKFAQ